MPDGLREFLVTTAREAGEIVRRSFGKIEHWETKSTPGDIVTEADYESERRILDKIRNAFPHDSIISEEAGKITAPTVDEAAEERVWLVDPLDGTRNYALGIPFFCVSIGVVEKGSVTHGVIYDPIHDNLYYAERGEGATMNGQPIHVSKPKDLHDAVISVSWSRPYTDYRQFVKYIERIAPHSSFFRRLGSAALVMCYVATGRIDAYLQGGLNSWDIAAGIVIVEEAGGRATDFCGSPIDLMSPSKLEILAASPTLHELMMRRVCGTGVGGRGHTR